MSLREVKVVAARSPESAEPLRTLPYPATAPSNRSQQLQRPCRQVAERNTWPKVEMIRSHCAVEMALEQCVQTLRRQLTAENQAGLCDVCNNLAALSGVSVAA